MGMHVVTIIKFPKKVPNSPFFDDIVNEGYHVYSLKKAGIPGYYPNKFPDYPGVTMSSLKTGDQITIRVFFKIGAGEDIRVDGGYLDLEIEHIEDDKVTAVLLTQLPDNFALETGASIEIFEEEILTKIEPTEH